MAKSDYLTDVEWDACFYVYLKGGRDFGAAIDFTVDYLLKQGYKFAGLDEYGNKAHQIHSSNSSKVLIWLGNPHNCDVLEIIDNGRTFLKKYAPDLVDETDEDWEKEQVAAKKQLEKG